MNGIIHFEIQAGDPERATKFYRDVFGWEIHEWIIPSVKMKDENRYWLVTTGPESEPGINGGLVFRQGSAPAEGQPVNAYVCTVEVNDLEKSMNNVLDAGGSITSPKMPIRGVGWWAKCKDTENNIFGILQEDKNAQ